MSNRDREEHHQERKMSWSKQTIESKKKKDKRIKEKKNVFDEKDHKRIEKKKKRKREREMKEDMRHKKWWGESRFCHSVYKHPAVRDTKKGNLTQPESSKTTTKSQLSRFFPVPPRYGLASREESWLNGLQESGSITWFLCLFKRRLGHVTSPRKKI